MLLDIIAVQDYLDKLEENSVIIEFSSYMMKRGGK